MMNMRISTILLKYHIPFLDSHYYITIRHFPKWPQTQAKFQQFSQALIATPEEGVSQFRALVGSGRSEDTDLFTGGATGLGVRTIARTLLEELK